MEKKKKYAIITFSIIALFPIISYFVFVHNRVSNENVLGVEDLPVEFRGGDFNTDGAISLSDFSIWLNGYREFKRSSVYSDVLDLDSNNKIDFTDFRSWLVIYRGYKEWVLNPPPLYTIKVLSLAYYPIADGVLDTTIVDNSFSEYNMTLEQVRTKVVSLEDGLESTLENGSKYRGYSNPNAVQSIDYIVESREFLQPVPGDPDKMYDATHYFTDYNAIMDSVNICDLVDNQGVRAVWIWAYTGIDRLGAESNMSGPYGDISNSDRDETDLPICDHTYVVYELNYGRDVACATESHMHQLEALFGHLDSYLFNTEFVGQGGAYDSVPNSEFKRCGNTHFPPNGADDYDYGNTAYVDTDCLDWEPNADAISVSSTDGSIVWDIETMGEISNLNCTTWGCDHRQWFEFWMQNMPGYNNGLTYISQGMPNWWNIVANLDTALSNGYFVDIPDALPTYPLVAYWPLENLSDSSGNQFNLSANDSLGVSSLVLVPGINGQAASFTRPFSDKYKLSVNPDPLGVFLRPSSFTIMAYVKRNDTPCNYNYCAIFSRGSSSFRGYTFGVAGQNLQLRINDNVAGQTLSTGTLQNNIWYHVAGTYDSSTGNLRVFIDGIPSGSSVDVGPINYQNEFVLIGNANSNYDLPFFGSIDEVRFFNTALTQEQISSYLLPLD